MKNVPIFMPYIGEFGSKLVKHAPPINGYCSEHKAIVCHEIGEDIIYPNAWKRHTFERPDETWRGAGGHRDQDITFEAIEKHFGPDRKYFTDREGMKIAPSLWFTPQERKQYEADFDVLLLTRRKEYAHGRNWEFWPELQGALKAEGIKCLVGGQSDSCQHLDCEGIWDIAPPDEILDATVWALKNATLVLGSPTGTTFLSVMCNVPPIVIISEGGQECLGSKRSFNAGSFYQLDANLHKCGWLVIAHWQEWRKVLSEFMEMYKDLPRFREIASYSSSGINLDKKKKKLQGETK